MADSLFEGPLPNAVNEVLIETKELRGSRPPHGLTMLRAISLDGNRMLCPRGDVEVSVGSAHPTQVTLTFYAKAVRIIPAEPETEDEP